MTTIDDDTRRRIIGLVLQAINQSFDGCEGGWSTDQAVARAAAIEHAELMGDLDEAWRLTVAWIKER